MLPRVLNTLPVGDDGIAILFLNNCAELSS